MVSYGRLRFEATRFMLFYLDIAAHEATGQKLLTCRPVFLRCVPHLEGLH